MNNTITAVGIDVSKGHSTVTFRQPGGIVVRKPFNVVHDRESLSTLRDSITQCGPNTRVIMEYTGRYYQPVARYLCHSDIFLAVVNPKLIRDFGDNKLRKVKTDKADAKKIADYGLTYWSGLMPYQSLDLKREQLKTLNRQFDFYVKQKTALTNNLISLLDMTYPGVEKFFSSPTREDGHQKWVDFATSFWHVDCVLDAGPSTFATRYEKWCKRCGYRCSPEASQIYEATKPLVATLPKDPITKETLMGMINILNTVSSTQESLRRKMDEIASTFPEYPVVMEMFGVGPSLGPQLIAEIGDVRRFHSRGAITAFAGVDPLKRHDSGQVVENSVPTTKKGSPTLRCTLYKIMEVLLKTAPVDDPVYQFMMKKKSEGKPYHVYMTAGSNKFLRIYYGRVREYLALLEDSDEN